MTELTELINVNIADCAGLVSPRDLKALLPDSDLAITNSLNGRRVLQDILDDKDKRLFCVVGPCSIHDIKAAHDYAEKLLGLARQVKDKIFVIMRVYFEKPRTTVGWKGLINDPFLDDSFHIDEGIKIARQFLLDLNEMGLPTATEALDPIIPQYLSELISWAAIGARTTESQTHREMASGLSMPVGFKNATDGSITTAINAMESSLNPHNFLGIDQDGKIAKFTTKGNKYGHVVLRGGTSGPNYEPKNIEVCEKTLQKQNLRKKIVVDCSHANSNKDFRNQAKVLQSVVAQIKAGNKALCGVMIESNLVEGNQALPKNLTKLAYGVSITDQCVGWATTVEMIQSAYNNL